MSGAEKRSNDLKRICVIGSMNVDCILKLARFHQPGETILAESMTSSPGGKGGNQAVAAAKLGVPVRMVGMLGTDDNGRLYERTLRENGVDLSLVQVLTETPSGLAIIEVDARGENRIIVVAGANMALTPAYIDEVLPQLLEDDIFLFQLESPIDTVCHAAKLLHAHGKTVVLDPAPAAPLPDALLACVDYLTPNRTELSVLSGMEVQTDEEVLTAAKSLLARGSGAVIAKLGGGGCLYIDPATVLRVPGFHVDTIDTTAAGDSFNAGFAAALSLGQNTAQALRFANAVGALSTTGSGAQGAMPSRAEAERLLTQP